MKWSKSNRMAKTVCTATLNIGHRLKHLLQCVRWKYGCTILIKGALSAYTIMPNQMGKREWKCVMRAVALRNWTSHRSKRIVLKSHFQLRFFYLCRYKSGNCAKYNTDWQCIWLSLTNDLPIHHTFSTISIRLQWITKKRPNWLKWILKFNSRTSATQKKHEPSKEIWYVAQLLHFLHFISLKMVMEMAIRLGKRERESDSHNLSKRKLRLLIDIR